MKTYELELISRLDEKVARFNFLHSVLDIKILKDILCPLTSYKLNIREIEERKHAFKLEEAVQMLTTSKLKKNYSYK